MIALVVLAGSVVLTASRLLDSEFEPLVLVASFVPWATGGYLVALALFSLLVWRQPWGRLRRALMVGASVALIGLGLHVWWLAPSYLGAHPSGKPDLTVVELNMLNGEANPTDVAALVRREHADLLVLTEVTPEALAGVAHEGGVGPHSPLPHVAGHALPGAEGVVIASRFGLSVRRILEMTHLGYVVEVQAPRPFGLLAVHSAQPAIDIGGWRRDQETVVRETRTLPGPRLVVGDLNATLDHPGPRRLLADGMVDAARQANAGWQPTWPSPGRPRVGRVPTPFGLFAIDHVLMSTHFGAVSTSTVVVRDSDHRALVARLVRN